MVDMTWPEIGRAAADGAIVLLPTGIIEEHGPHLGLAVDTYIPDLIGVMARRELASRAISALVAPPCYWGVSQGTAVFPGTFSVRRETMKAIVYDILASLHGWGFKRTFAVNWHADFQHCRVLLETFAEARRGMGMDALCLLSEADIRRLRLTGEEDYVLRYNPPPMNAPSQSSTCTPARWKRASWHNITPPRRMSRWRSGCRRRSLLSRTCAGWVKVMPRQSDLFHRDISATRQDTIPGPRANTSKRLPGVMRPR